MKELFFDGSNTDKETIKTIIEQLNYKLPSDFVDVIIQHDGAYLSPNTIFEGIDENNVNNLISFDENDPSFILDIIKDMGLDDLNIIPIAEDPFGNIFGFRFTTDKKYEVVFFDSELENVRTICDTFTEFINLIHD